MLSYIHIRNPLISETAGTDLSQYASPVNWYIDESGVAFIGEVTENAIK